MPIIKLINSISNTIFKSTNTTIKEVSKHKWSTPKWEYDKLIHKDYPFLHSSEYLKELMHKAIKSKDKESLVKIMNHIAKHNAHEIGGYKLIIKTIKKAIENLI